MENVVRIMDSEISIKEYKGVDFFKVKCSEVRPFFGQTLPNGFNPSASLTEETR